jgi:hypothetical protein
MKSVHRLDPFHETTYTESRERRCGFGTVGAKSAHVAKIEIQQFEAKTSRAGRPRPE